MRLQRCFYGATPIKNAKILAFALTVSVTAIASPRVQAIERDAVVNLIKQRGGKISEVEVLAVSTDRDITPVLYYEKGNSVPSCGLFARSPKKTTPDFIELVGSDPGVNFPQCLNIVSIAPFNLQARRYLAIEYISRETRDEVYRNFHYLYKDTAQGYQADELLNEAVPGIPTTVSESMPSPAKARDGIRGARVAYLKKKFPNWTAQERDFISEANSSFLPFEEKNKQRCHFVAEAGMTPVDIDNQAYISESRCVVLLASSRLIKTNKTYYIELFEAANGKRMASIISVSPEGKITAEKSLANEVIRTGATNDIKTTKAALVNLIR